MINSNSIQFVSLIIRHKLQTNIYKLLVYNLKFFQVKWQNIFLVSCPAKLYDNFSVVLKLLYCLKASDLKFQINFFSFVFNLFSWTNLKKCCCLCFSSAVPLIISIFVVSTILCLAFLLVSVANMKQQIDLLKIQLGHCKYLFLEQIFIY